MSTRAGHEVGSEADVIDAHEFLQMVVLIKMLVQSGLRDLLHVGIVAAANVEIAEAVSPITPPVLAIASISRSEILRGLSISARAFVCEQITGTPLDTWIASNEVRSSCDRTDPARFFACEFLRHNDGRPG